MSAVAVVTGSNKGIGLSIVKGLCQRFDGVVYLTSRDETRGLAAVEELKKQGLNPEYYQLDVSDRSSVEKFRDHIREKYDGLNLLVNNAAVVDKNPFDNDFEDCKRVIDINYNGLLTMQEIIFPLVKNGGRILNISSCAGHLSNVRNKFWIYRLKKRDLSVDDVNEFVKWFLNAKEKGTFTKDQLADNSIVCAYRVSKVAIAALTIVQQKLFNAKNICINSMHPGIVKTDMTSSRGFYTVDEAAETPLYLLLEAPDTIKGAFVWYDKKIIDWYDHESDLFFNALEIREMI